MGEHESEGDRDYGGYEHRVVLCTELNGQPVQTP